MNVNLEKTGDVTAKIVVNVAAADYTDKVKKELKRFADTHVVPGFRKGHVPMDQLRRRFGKGVKSDVINDLVYREVIKYLQDNKIKILGEPMPENVQEINLDDTDYTFTYDLGLTPTFDVEANKDVTLPFYTIAVSDEMRAEQDKAFRERFGAQVPGDEVEEKALVKGAIMELNPDGTINESSDAIQVINGIVGPSYFKSEDEKAKFMGKHVNDKVVFNPYNTCEGNVAELSSMLNIDKDKAADVKSDFEMAISEIIVLRPAEHDQDFFDNVFGKDKVHNEEEYTEALTKMIANSLINNSYQLFSEQTRKYYLDKCKDVELPETFLKKWLVARNEGLTPENIDEEYANMKEQLLWQLIEDELRAKLNVEVTDDDMLAFAKQITFQQFAQYGMTNLGEEIITQQAKHLLTDDKYRQRIVETVSSNKLFAVIHANVTIDDKTVSVEEFKTIAQNA